MKFQPKRFVVEVKRGTSRAAFTSPDPAAEKFSGAEAMLFGRSAQAQPESQRTTATKPGRPEGRILRSLVEPPPPAPPDLPEPARRGRKPGSKNKPKPHQLAIAGESEIVVDKPRRGRKPGSKNKPKHPVPAVVAAADLAGLPAEQAAMMRSYGFSDDGAVWDGPAPEPITFSKIADITPLAEPEPWRTGEAGRMRPRLRDRSVILRRYVLNLEPGPGQFGFRRARRPDPTAR